MANRFNWLRRLPFVESMVSLLQQFGLWSILAALVTTVMSGLYGFWMYFKEHVPWWVMVPMVAATLLLSLASIERAVHLLAVFRNRVRKPTPEKIRQVGSDCVHFAESAMAYLAQREEQEPPRYFRPSIGDSVGREKAEIEFERYSKATEANFRARFHGPFIKCVSSLRSLGFEISDFAGVHMMSVFHSRDSIASIHSIGLLLKEERMEEARQSIRHGHFG